jgi:hypothetical protein
MKYEFDMHEWDYNTHKSDLYTQSAISTCRVRFLHEECNLNMQCDFNRHEYDYNTHECDFMAH